MCMDHTHTRRLLSKVVSDLVFVTTTRKVINAKVNTHLLTSYPASQESCSYLSGQKVGQGSVVEWLY